MHTTPLDLAYLQTPPLLTDIEMEGDVCTQATKPPLKRRTKQFLEAHPTRLKLLNCRNY